MDETPSVDENLIASIIKRYVKHWMQKIRSFRIGLSFPPRCRTTHCRIHKQQIKISMSK